MKLLKKIGLVLIALYIIGFILPSSFSVERSSVIKAEPETVQAVINDLRSWQKWSPWFQMDPDMKIEYQNGGVGPGSSYTWDSKKMGRGKMEIVSADPNLVSTKLSFDGRGSANANFVITPEGADSKVTWKMDSNGEGIPIWKKPITNYMNLFMGKMLGGQFEKGLDNLANLVATIPPIAKGKVDSIDVKETPAINFIEIESTCSQRAIGDKLTELYGKIGAKMAECKVQQVSAPMAKYPNYNPADSTVKIIAMIPVDKICNAKMDPTMKSYSLKPMKVVLAMYTGPYETNRMAYEAIEKYMLENKLTSAGDPYEEYANDPMEAKDPGKFITNVYWPVK